MTSRTDRPRRPRRCQLSVPGSSEKMLAKGAGLAVDHVFLDLEDAVAPNMKPAARGMIVEALNSLEWRPRTVCLRINDVETEWCHDDIIEVVTGAGASAGDAGHERPLQCEWAGVRRPIRSSRIRVEVTARKLQPGSRPRRTEACRRHRTGSRLPR